MQNHENHENCPHYVHKVDSIGNIRGCIIIKFTLIFYVKPDHNAECGQSERKFYKIETHFVCGEIAAYLQMISHP